MSRQNSKKRAEHRDDLKPHVTNIHAKFIAKRPNLTRIIFYLYDHGIAGQVELHRHLKTVKSVEAVHCMMRHLIKAGLVEQIDKRRVAQVDNRRIGYQLTPLAIQEPEFLQELYTLFLYEFLTAVEQKCFNPPYDWKTIDELREDQNFNGLMSDWGFTFKKAIRLVVDCTIFSTKSDGKVVTAIRRAFGENGYPLLIEEEELRAEEQELSEVEDISSLISVGTEEPKKAVEEESEAEEETEPLMQLIEEVEEEE